MNKQDRIWQLYARKMAREASPQELEELAELIKDDPSLSMQLQLMTEFWENSPPVPVDEHDAAFNRILKQAEKPEEKNEEPKPLPVNVKRGRRRRSSFKPALLRAGMLRNYAVVAGRSLMRNKSFSAINIAGLALGMASAVVILIWIFHELSVDQFHSRKERIYQVLNRANFDGQTEVWGSTPKPLAPFIQQHYPQVEATARLNWVSLFVLHAGAQQYQVPGYFTDPGFFRMFDFPLLKGEASTALAKEYSIVITETMARKLFGNTDVLGHTIRLDSSDLFTVTGVLRDLPNNTDINFNYLLPWSYMKKVGWDDSLWQNSNILTLVMLKPGIGEKTANSLFSGVIRKNAPGAENDLFVHPMKKWHLYTRFENGVNTGGHIEMVRLFSIIAAFILLIACINYVNMSTARSQKRAREVGIRKVSGAGRLSLIGQFLGESVLISFLAGLLALAIIQPALSGFNFLINEKLTVPWNSPAFWWTALGFIVCTGILAGIYPAFYLSSYQPVHVLKGHFKRLRLFVTPRKILVTLQFSFALIMIICTIVIYRQIRHAQKRDPGYNGNGLTYMYMKGKMEENYPKIREALLETGAINNITRSSCPITDVWASENNYHWQGQSEGQHSIVLRYTADRNYVATMGLTLLEGRDLDVTAYPSDTSAVLINQAAARLMGFAHPVGEKIEQEGQQLEIVGVIRNFIPDMPYQGFMPAVIQGATGKFGAISFRLSQEGNKDQKLATIAKVFRQYNPDYPFEHFFADETYALKFRREKVLGTLAALFAGLTIFISCLGLFALAACLAENRIKEIGVRKVLGASVTRITALLSKDFLLPVIFSILIASPVAWWSMDHWLRGYTYRTSISGWIFVSAALMIIGIALVTISYQTVKAALSNPVKSIRTE